MSQDKSRCLLWEKNHPDKVDKEKNIIYVLNTRKILFYCVASIITPTSTVNVHKWWVDWEFNYFHNTGFSQTHQSASTRLETNFWVLNLDTSKLHPGMIGPYVVIKVEYKFNIYDIQDLNSTHHKLNKTYKAYEKPRKPTWK